ncbi:unnamed protein product, partial [Closterium sp. Yama58-4]
MRGTFLSTCSRELPLISPFSFIPLSSFTFGPSTPRHLPHTPSSFTAAQRRAARVAPGEADSPAALGERALYRKMVCSQRGGSCFQSNVLFAWVLRHHLACQVDLLPALACCSPHSPPHHQSPQSSSLLSRSPPAPTTTSSATLGAISSAPSPATASSADHAAASLARLTSPADSAQRPVQSASAAALSASAEMADHVRREEGVGGEAAPCPPGLTHAAGGQAAAAAAVRAGEQWYVVERLCRVGPSEAGGVWAGADGKHAAWGGAACGEEAQWQALYRFSSWPRDAPHFLQCMRHASLLGGPRVAVRVCSEGEGEGEVGGRGVIREMIRDRHLLLLDGDGSVQRQQQLATDEEFSAVVRGRFGIRLGADDVRAVPPVPREPPLGDA